MLPEPYAQWLQAHPDVRIQHEEGRVVLDNVPRGVKLPPGLVPSLNALGDELATTLTDIRLPSRSLPLSPGTSAVADGVPWTRPVTTWPVLASEAYYGLAGNIVRAIEPHSEADPVAVLIQLLVLIGNCIGHAPYFQIEADRHHLNLYAATVGSSAGSRKGTAYGRARQPLEAVDEHWIAHCIEGGLSSAEGLLWRVRDEVSEWQVDKKTGEGKYVVTDPGIADKRLMVVENEFASVLKQFQRDGNALSPILRNGWDGRTLSSMTKNSPAKATGAHLSLIGHITRDELLRYFDRTEAANGMGNRVLWVAVRSSKLLPDGGGEVNLAPFIPSLHRAITHARTVGQMRRDETATALWHEVYPALRAEVPGMVGAMMARAAPITVRLSMLYALLDGCREVGEAHLRAALALWDYAAASVRWIFGDTLGDPEADETLRELRKIGMAGMTRTEISGLFSNNRSAARIGQVLAALEAARLARCEFQTPEGGKGRPSERWFAV